VSSSTENDKSQIAWLVLTGVLGAGLVYFGKKSKSSLINSIAVTIGSGLIVKSVSQTIIGGLLSTD
jgi:hypothetical protein